MPFPETLLADIRARLDYAAVFTEYVGTLHGRGDERRARCPFHDNSSTPLAVNTRAGLYHCHNPECAASGDIFDLVQRCESLDFSHAVERLAARAGVQMPDSSARGGAESPSARLAEPILDAQVRAGVPREAPVAEADMPPIDEAVPAAFQAALESNGEMLQRLAQRRGLNRATVERMGIGYDGQRYTIPVYDAAGHVRNIRRYDPDARQARAKMISWRTGYGEARLYPIASVLDVNDHRPIVLCEGEMDCLLAIQTGLRAITTTGGAGTWREQWNEMFRDKELIICYDCDDAGRRGANSIAHHLAPYARTVRIVDLGLTEPVGADFTDYVHGHGHTLTDFVMLIGTTPLFTPEDTTPARIEEEPRDVHLSHASRPEYQGHPIRTNANMIGKTMAPNTFPSTYEATCSLPGKPMCLACKLGTRVRDENATSGRLSVAVDDTTNAPLTLIGVNDETKLRRMKVLAQIPQSCNYVRFAVGEPKNIETILLIPEIDRTTRGTEYVTRAAYYFGDGLEANRQYLFTGYTVADPNTQAVTHVFTRAQETRSSLDQFVITQDTRERLRVFQPDDVDDLGAYDERLAAIYGELELVTRIYERRDVMLTCDLTYHSQLAFSFQGELLARGWCDALIIGDTRTGKSSIAIRLSEHYQAGEVTSGENTSFSGLVGGLTPIGDSWAVRWGKFPTNTRRLVVLDEAGNLPADSIARMSSMRSSGIAEVTKIHTERTDARTRAIWIGNPRGNRPLATYSHGALAVRELIGAPEDVARFDLICTAAAQDVTLNVVNQARSGARPTIYTSELCHQRTMWAWSRQASQILLTDEATARVLWHANRHGEQYRFASEIPIVESNEQRVKIARLAVACAGMFFSTDETGTTVIVRPAHVDFVARFLDQLYGKPSLAYAEYARMQTRRYTLTITERLARLVRRPGAPRALQDQEQFSLRDIQEILGIDEREELRTTITFLRDSGFFRRLGSSAYVKTAAAINYLRDLITAEGDEGDGAPVTTEAPARDPFVVVEDVFNDDLAF